MRYKDKTGRPLVWTERKVVQQMIFELKTKETGRVNGLVGTQHEYKTASKKVLIQALV